MVASATPAMANDRSDRDRGDHFGVLDDNHVDRDLFDEEEEEDVDIERERFGDLQCILVIEEEGNDEDLEDVFCFPRTGAFDAVAFDPFIG
jgi:hypothetical protein